MRLSPRSAPFLHLLIVVLFIALTSACTEPPPADDIYFQALTDLEHDLPQEALLKLTDGLSLKNRYAALCAEELLSVVQHNPQLAITEKVLVKARDTAGQSSSALQDYGKILISQKRFDEFLTFYSTLEKPDAVLTAYRLQALYKTATTYDEELAFLNELDFMLHNSPYSATLSSVIAAIRSDRSWYAFAARHAAYLSYLEPLRIFRSRYFSADYEGALQQLDALMPSFSRKGYLSGCSDQLLQDIGNTLILAAEDKAAAGALFLQAAELTDRPTTRWILCFYAGRLFEKSGGTGTQQALAAYLSAYEAAASDYQHDRALWYYLELTRKNDKKNIMRITAKYAAEWTDPSYFDDFLSRLASDLLSEHEWKPFYMLTEKCWDYLSPDITAQFSYICARLLETGLCSVSSDPAEEAARLYESCLEHATYDSYYGMLARYRTMQMERAFPVPAADSLAGTDPEADELLEGLISHDIASRVFPFVKAHYQTLTSDSIAAAFSYLNSQPDVASNYLQLVSLGSKTAGSRAAESRILQLAYPAYYRDIIESTAGAYDIPAYQLFALIRIESAFQAEISSTAGAQGLTQLMPSTAADTARKLKLEEYDLADPATNTEIGCYYFTDLIRRLDGNILLAAFSYNGGITRVRNWRKAAPDLPYDLFLETVPFEETRQYGRKMLVASVMYGALYYNEQPADIIQSILNFHD